jgi:hypothetical protein
VARPERLELPTFWFVGGFCALQQTTLADNTQRNQRETPVDLGSRRTVLYPVHGQLHGQLRERPAFDFAFLFACHASAIALIFSVGLLF